MAKKFVRPDAEQRQAEAAKMMRLRALRLAKETDDAAKSAAAKLDAAVLRKRPIR